MKSKLHKLRQVGFDELRVRGSQALAAFAERKNWSSSSKLISDDALLRLFDGEISDLQTHFRERTEPKFFASFADPQATIDELRRRWPGAENLIIKRAERILAGYFDLLGFRGLSFGKPIDWHLEPVAGKRAPLVHWSQLNYLDAELFGDKKITWELNRHQYFITLGQAYWLTGDERYAGAFVEHVNSWMDQNPPKLGINWASSLEIAFRSIAWIWALHFFKKSDALTAETFSKLCKFLYLNARHLETFLSTYFSPNTHLTGEALGLFYLGALMPEFKESARWRTKGLEILLGQLPRHVQSDGVYFEQSSYYHRYTTDFYLHLRVLLSNAGAPIPAVLDEKLRLLLDHLMYITRPDGTTPLFGDDDGGRLLSFFAAPANDFRATLATGAALFDRADYKFVAGDAVEDVLWLLGPGDKEQVSKRIEEVRIEQVRKRGLPPLTESRQRRGQAPLPDLFYSDLFHPPTDLFHPPTDLFHPLPDLFSFDQIVATEPEKTSVAFPAGGYYVMRDGWTKKSNYLLFDCGPHGTANCGHAHADALSFELAVKGKTTLVDPGTYTYTGSKYMRDEFRSSEAHNTLVIDNESSSESDGPFSWKTIAHSECSSWITEESFDYVRASHDGFMRLSEPVKHTRSILFIKNGYWVVRDVVETSGNHGLQARFHFDPRAPGLNISAFAKNFEYGKENGWVSECYGEKKQASVITISVLAKGSEELVVFLLPDAGAIVREIEAPRGRAFEILIAGRRDVLKIDGQNPPQISTNEDGSICAVLTE